jgi:hypothetical protein
VDQYGPNDLFLFLDGPRIDRPNEIDKINEIVNLFKKYNWSGNIHTNFQEKNLGCKSGPITAIDWFFENVDEGIILEDDCVPDQTFFTFCRKLLTYYRNNQQIMHISGNNFQNGILRGDKNASYYFSKYTHSWGWATWKRAWQMFRPAIDNFDNFIETNMISSVGLKSDAKKFWIKNLNQTINGNDSWDSLWMYTVWYNNGLAILPQNNLVSNIGFDENATHTKEKNESSYIKTFPINDVAHTKNIHCDHIADEYTFKTLFKKSIIQRIIYKIRNII